MADPNAEFFKGIRQDINNAMIEGNDREALYVTTDSLEKIWSNRLERFCEIAGFREIRIQAAEQLKKELLQTLSILVYIGWGAWDEFKNIFFNSLYSKPGSRWDENIEHYTLAQLENSNFLGDTGMARLFMQCRDIFIPIVIEEGSAAEFKAGRRLPFLRSENSSKVLGQGAFGTVTKEFIAIKQYKHDDNYNWEPYPVARKVLGTQVHFKKEVENLRELRKALLEHKRIAPFLAIISVGTEFNILSKLADMNLQEFLDGRYDEFNISSNALMTEFSNLASALAFLHDRIQIPGRGCVFCCHMDLKPENILVYKKKDHPVGIWMISDFGISTIKRSEIEPKEKSKAADNFLQVPSMLGDLKGRLTPLTGHTSAKRPRGTWQAPEVEMSSGKVVGRESDVWSLGCMFVSICALDVGGPDELDWLGRQRGKTIGGDSYDDKNGDCFWWETETKDKVLNPHIESWVESLSDRKGHDDNFLLNCKSLIFSALKIPRDDRISAHAFSLALQGIRRKQPKLPRIHVNGSEMSSLVILGEETANVAPESVHSTASRPQPDINLGFGGTTNGAVEPTPQLQDSPLSPEAVTPLRQSDGITSLMSEPSLVDSSSSAPKEDDKGKGKEIIEESPKVISDIRTTSTISQLGRYSEDERKGVWEHSKITASLGGLPGGPQPLECPDVNSASIETSLADTVNPRGPAPTTISQDSPLQSTAGPNPRRNQTEPATSSSVPLFRPAVDHSSRSAPAGPGNLISGPTSRFPPASRMNSMASALSSTNNSSVFSGSDSGRATKRTKFNPPNLKGLIQTIIPPSCEIIAFLSNDAIYVYPINNLHDQYTVLAPPPNFKWLSASISGLHILARGQQISTKATMFQVYEILDHGTVCREKGPKFVISGACEEGSISPDGYIMYQYQSKVWMSHIDLTRSPKIWLPSEASKTTIKRSWFNESGTFTYIWSVHLGRHHLRAWKISDVANASAYFQTPVNDDSEEDSDPVQGIIAFPRTAAFAVWKSDNRVKLITEPKAPNAGTLNQHDIPQLEALVIDRTENFAICIRRVSKGIFRRPTYKLCINKLMFTADGKVLLEGVKEVDLRYPFQQNSCISVSTVGNEIRVFIGHCTGKLEHYTLDETTL